MRALNRGGPQHTETQTYAPDGSVAGRWVAESDAKAGELRVTEEKGGVPPRKIRNALEYDAHKNLIKTVRYEWNAGAGEYEPALVYYSAIEYYR